MMNSSLKRLDLTCGFRQGLFRDQPFVIEAVYSYLLFKLVQLEVVFIDPAMHL